MISGIFFLHGFKRYAMKLKNYIALRIPSTDAPANLETNQSNSPLQSKSENRIDKEQTKMVIHQHTVAEFFYQTKEKR